MPAMAAVKRLSQSRASGSLNRGSWFSGFLKTDIDPDGAGHWGATRLPGGLPDTNWGGSFLVIPEQSENKEAAWAFVSYMLATAKGQNDMFAAVDYFPAYEPAWEAAPELYTDLDPYFSASQDPAPNAIATEIAANVPTVYNTIMDTTAEGYLYSSFNAGAEAGETPEQIRDRLGKDIEAACAELKEQQNVTKPVQEVRQPAQQTVQNTQNRPNAGFGVPQN